MMKRMITAVLAIVMMFTLTACQGKNGAADVKNLEGTTSELIEKVYETTKPEFGVMTQEVDLTDSEAVKYMTGLDNADKISEVSVSEPMTGSQAYSLVMVRVKDAKDTKEVAEAMKAGINPAKWICVEADDIAVAGYGDVAMLIMVSSQFSDSITAAGVVDAFKTVCGGTLSF